MRNIKNIYRLITLVLLFIAYNTTAQQVNQNITGTYTGTWQYDSNNECFIVKIWQEGSHYYGHYKKIQLTNGTVGNTIYNSNKMYSNGAKLPFTISGKSGSQYGLSGLIYDNTITGNSEDFQ